MFLFGFVRWDRKFFKPYECPGQILFCEQQIPYVFDYMDVKFGDSYDALEQEKKKLERKRARNRLAASKCRQKKLQKINDLEKQVEEEKLKANRLNEDLKLLETSIAQLRQLLQEHHNNGCSVSVKVIST
ncbi:unnamed protein product [Wuchereria bancrofti]|uniref:BZIP domain-containing protein n=1 Tax=Wuchereria bancrofti TaxID=6293 RepID=A0A3P7EIW4_WUCBA|nr:unnamed protein product [Wuchereria bancrofti]